MVSSSVTGLKTVQAGAVQALVVSVEYSKSFIAVHDIGGVAVALGVGVVGVAVEVIAPKFFCEPSMNDAVLSVDAHKRASTRIQLPHQFSFPSFPCHSRETHLVM